MVKSSESADPTFKLPNDMELLEADMRGSDGTTPVPLRDTVRGEDRLLPL